MPKPARFIFTRKNYSLILVSVCLLIIGFVLMTGKGNTGTDQFNEDIFSFRRITLSPLIILAGYTLMIYAILPGRGKQKNSKNDRS